jgi:hypothetical protein
LLKFKVFFCQENNINNKSFVKVLENNKTTLTTTNTSKTFKENKEVPSLKFFLSQETLTTKVLSKFKVVFISLQKNVSL